ncbi:hypothetical protein ABTZ58_02730 [Streptomyces sp. NPDC094143]|uniref:hypothetical protein n=1 Tax=Streptomyces sp. NPDC094143 TaxID=3155310 RepID=UPI00332830A4
MHPAAQPVPRGTRRHTWPRVLVLLLALLVPGAHTAAHAVPALPAVQESTAVEYDAFDTVLRPAARSARRAAVPRRPAPFPGPAPACTARRHVPVPPDPPHDPRPLRSEVLRC